MKIRMLTALIGAALLTSCFSSAKPQALRFCPQDRAWCGGGECPLDDKGMCKACGKPPVELVGAAPETFFRCEKHGVWHFAVCDLNSANACCSAQEVLVMLESQAGNVVSSSYCPKCRAACGADCPLDGGGKCKACGIKPLEVNVVLRTWYWCSHHVQWHDEPCGENLASGCCVKHSAALPVTNKGW